MPDVAERAAYHHVPDLTSLLDEIAPESIISRTVHKDARVKVTLFGFAVGQELSEHTSSKPAVIQILAGEAQLGLGKEVMEARAGSWTLMEPHLKHSLVARTPVVMLLTMLLGEGLTERNRDASRQRKGSR